jgi:hypothetical protein
MPETKEWIDLDGEKDKLKNLRPCIVLHPYILLLFQDGQIGYPATLGSRVIAPIALRLLCHVDNPNLLGSPYSMHPKQNSVNR